MTRTIAVLALVVLVLLVALMATTLALAATRGGGVRGGGGEAGPRVHVVVPFRAGADQPERAAQLDSFLERLGGWAAAAGHDIHVVEQSDAHRFNRGALLNAGYSIVAGAEGGAGGGADADIFVFHDVDLLPDDELLATYGDPPPVHFAAVWGRYAKTAKGRPNLNYLGGALSLSGKQFREIGGFPNDFWGWGGEDDELRERLKAAGLFARVARPRRGRLEDLERLTLPEKLAVLKAKGLKCPHKWERRDAHNARRARGIAARGLAQAGETYLLVRTAERAPGVSVHTVCLREPAATTLTRVEAPAARGGRLPHADAFQRALESQIERDLAMYPPAEGVYAKMRAYAAAELKYERSCVFVEADERGVRLEAPNPDSPHWKTHMADERTLTYRQMFADLAAWCARHGLAFPRGRFALYVTDTYAWEKGARDLPWLVIARPANQPGVLVPDDSFLTHTRDGGPKPLAAGMTWAWDDVVAEARALAPPRAKTPGVFFRGANTGADKYATRADLARARWRIPAAVALSSGRGARQPIFDWGTREVLLNLPGHQPWSYRLKYLFLLRSVVFNVDVAVTYGRGDRTARWVQFFDGAFRPGADYVSFTLEDVDRAPKRVRRAASERLVRDIEQEYGALGRDPGRARAMAAAAFSKATTLSSSRILQYLFRLLTAYAERFPS